MHSPFYRSDQQVLVARQAEAAKPAHPHQCALSDAGAHVSRLTRSRSQPRAARIADATGRFGVSRWKSGRWRTHAAAQPGLRGGAPV